MREQVTKRLAELKAEFESGQARLREVERQVAYLRETLLRISGAIQVLEELLGHEPQENGASPHTVPEPVLAGAGSLS